MTTKAYQEFREAAEVILADYQQYGITWDDVENGWGFIFPEDTPREDVDAIARRLTQIHDQFVPDESNELGPFGTWIGDGFQDSLKAALDDINNQVSGIPIKATLEQGEVAFTYPRTTNDTASEEWDDEITEVIKKMDEAFVRQGIMNFHYWEICDHNENEDDGPVTYGYATIPCWLWKALP